MVSAPIHRPVHRRSIWDYDTIELDFLDPSQPRFSRTEQENEQLMRDHDKQMDERIALVEQGIFPPF